MEINWVILGWIIDMILNGFVWLLIAAIFLVFIDVTDTWTRKAVKWIDKTDKWIRKLIDDLFEWIQEKNLKLISSIILLIIFVSYESSYICQIISNGLAIIYYLLLIKNLSILPHLHSIQVDSWIQFDQYQSHHHDTNVRHNYHPHHHNKCPQAHFLYHLLHHIVHHLLHNIVHDFVMHL